MPLNEAEFLKELRQAFAQEAQEHLQAMTSGLLALEQGSAGPQAGRVLEEVYRAAHSLKGAARAVSEHEVEALAHAMEDVFSAVRQTRLELRPEGYDELQRALSSLEAMLAAPEAVAPPAVRDLRARLASLAKGAAAGEQQRREREEQAGVMGGRVGVEPDEELFQHGGLRRDQSTMRRRVYDQSKSAAPSACQT